MKVYVVFAGAGVVLLCELGCCCCWWWDWFVAFWLAWWGFLLGGWARVMVQERMQDSFLCRRLCLVLAAYRCLKVSLAGRVERETEAMEA